MGARRGSGVVVLLVLAAACTLDARRDATGSGGYEVTIRRDG